MTNQPYYGAYSAFTNFLTYIASQHVNVASVGIGELDDYSLTGEDDYPRVFVELPISMEYGIDLIKWKLSISVTDQTGVGREQEQVLISQCFDLANDLMEMYKSPDQVYSGYTNSMLFLQDDYNFITITRYGDDATAGVRIDLSVIQKIPMNKCDISQLLK